MYHSVNIKTEKVKTDSNSSFVVQLGKLGLHDANYSCEYYEQQ